MHVVDVLGSAASDERIWEFARVGGFVIVSKDEDFQRFSVWRGWPPKVIWIQLGNCSTDEVVALLREAHPLIAEFVAHLDAGFLPLRARDA